MEVTLFIWSYCRDMKKSYGYYMVVATTATDAVLCGCGYNSS
jgi:hypothetical protein